MSWRAQGMRTWLLQRMTAVYVAVYIIVAVVYLIPALPLAYSEWRDLFASPFINIATLFFIYALLAHAWVGMRDILIDYIHQLSLRFILMTLLGVLQFSLAIWVSMVMFSVVSL